MNRAILYKTAHGWMMLHVGPWAAEVKDLFGTETLPTAFTECAEANEVRAAIQRLNPTVRVEVRS